VHWFEIARGLEIPDTLGTVLNDYYTWVPHDRLCMAYFHLGRVWDAYGENEQALSFRPSDERLLYNQRFLMDQLFPGRVLEQPVRLNLGGGGKPVPSYRNCDLFAGPGVREIFSLEAVPYPDGFVHALYSEHALEHAPTHLRARQAVTEWARVLRYGGDLVLKVPDLEECVKQFLEAEDREKREGERFSPRDWFKATIFGAQDMQGFDPPGAQHHNTGFTKTELKRLLEKNGFEVRSMKNYDGFDTPSVEVHAKQVKKPVRVRWLIEKVDERAPQTRIRRTNIHRFLLSQGVDSEIIEGYRGNEHLLEDLRNADVVVVSVFAAEEQALMERLIRCGIAVVFDVCEDLEGVPYYKECLERATIISCSSTVLAKKLEKYGRTVVLPDAYELPASLPPQTPKSKRDGGKLRAVWCGMGGNAKNCDFLRPILEELDMELVIISEWDSADKKWGLDTWLADHADADICICPADVQNQPAKSNVKVTQAMALGLPVVASPLPAYREIIRHGENGFLAGTEGEWREALEELRDEERRKTVSKEGEKTVGRYSIEKIGEQWLALLKDLCFEICSPPKVDIIVLTLNNLPYLQACIESIRENTAHPYNIIVVNSGTDATADWLAQQVDIIRHNSPERLHFSAANNIGLGISKERYVVLLNDDTIVSRNWLTCLMHEGKKPGIACVNPFSNCDQGWLHHERIQVGGKNLRPAMKLEQIQDILPAIYSWQHPKVVQDREWVAFFSTLIKKEVIEKVGTLDETFQSGCEDVDFCKRATKEGYRCLQTYDSWVFHFGGVTREMTQKEDPEKYQEEDLGNHAALRSKYERPLFVLYTGAAWERWGPQSIDKGGIGGSETCAVRLAEQFAKKGYRSIVFSDCSGMEGEHGGVEYRDYRGFSPFAQNSFMDIFVSSRRPEAFALDLHAGVKLCWVHDIWLDKNPKAPLHVDNVDKFLVLSPWHQEFFCQHHGVPVEKTWITRDGVDLSRYAQELPRKPGKLIYSSSPDRGLDVLLHLFPRIRARVPYAELHVFYGFNNWEKAIAARNDAKGRAWMEQIKEALKRDGVVYRGRVGQAELVREELTSELWVYPTFFWETFCITAAEMMAAGLPVVTSDLAALSTTVGDAGIIIPGDCWSNEYQDRFVEECVRMLTDKKRWKEYSERSLEKAKQYTWDTLADEWLAMIQREQKVLQEART
jgi:glycosyltransferase involved in cell wall biosynthesis/predicted SAM-dependent methyltransferase